MKALFAAEGKQYCKARLFGADAGGKDSENLQTGNLR